MALTTQAALRKDLTNGQNATLEHRHFAFIAATIKAIEHNPTRHKMAGHFADACAHTNPRFDRRRFLAACGDQS